MFEHNIDIVYGVLCKLDIPEFYSRFDEYPAI